MGNLGKKINIKNVKENLHIIQINFLYKLTTDFISICLYYLCLELCKIIYPNNTNNKSNYLLIRKSYPMCELYNKY